MCVYFLLLFFICSIAFYSLCRDDLKTFHSSCFVLHKKNFYKSELWELNTEEENMKKKSKKEKNENKHNVEFREENK